MKRYHIDRKRVGKEEVFVTGSMSEKEKKRYPIEMVKNAVEKKCHGINQRKLK